MKEKLKVLDLFSGIGGFSLGLERAGMETVAFCENDIPCQEVLRKNWPKIPIFNDVKNLRSLHNIGCSRQTSEKGSTFEILGCIDIICGGFPCQDISVAGQKRGIKGERSGLWKEFKRIIKEVEPRYAIIENVANLRNMGLKEIIKDLWEIGYVCEWHIISARSIGACHLRERIWIIAYPQRGIVWEQSRRRGGKSRENKIQSQPASKKRRAHTPNSDMPRFWQSFTSEKEKSEWWTKATSCVGDRWEVGPKPSGMDDGLSRELDKNKIDNCKNCGAYWDDCVCGIPWINEPEKARKERVKQLGNSVVPFIPEIIGRAIIDYEKDAK